jgi:tetratricopeptide (TPR) repeat protein
MRTRRLTWLLLAAAAISTHAQDAGIPRRPNLGTGADTNDAKSYYVWGVEEIGRHPEDAARALYWATRINPSWAEAYYAEWAALQLSNPRRLELYLKGDKGTHRSPAIRRIDSVYMRAAILEPFAYRKFEALMFEELARRGGTTTTRERLDVMTVDSSMVNGAGGFPTGRSGASYSSPGSYTTYRSPYQKPWAAYANGNIPLALKEWASVLVSNKERSLILGDRGRAFYLVAVYDSAAVQFVLAAAEWRPEDKDRVPAASDSKTLYEYSLGLVEEKLGRPDSACAVYRRLIEEDPSFAAAHLRLSALALADHDTAASLGELDIAAQVEPSNEVIAYLYASALIRAGHDAEALEQLKRAVALDPYYAAPRMLMAMVYEAAGMRPEAVAEYRAYLRIASESDPLVVRARARVAAAGGDAVPPNR